MMTPATIADTLPDVKRMNIYFRVGEWKELQAIASKMDIPAARLLRRILRDWLRRHRGKGRK
jgi:hypothetical protein